MVPVRVALLGVAGTLAGVWVTQLATTRRESNRDQLKWAQERQQRDFDIQRAAISESLLTINAWVQRVIDVSNYLRDPDKSEPDVSDFNDLEIQASRAYVTIELFCTDAVKEATHHTLDTIQGLSQRVVEGAKQVTLRRANDPKWRNMTLKSHEEWMTVDNLTRVCKAELAKLLAEPLALSKPERKRLSLPWRKSGASA